MRNNSFSVRPGAASLLFFACFLTIIAAPTAVLAHGEPDCQALLDQHSKSIVTIKLMLTIKGGFVGPEGQQIESETNGIMVDPSGVVVASSTELGGLPPTLRALMSRTGEMTVTPSDIKVLVDDDAEGVEAEIITRDSDLDLAWVRITAPREQPYPTMSLEKDVKSHPGQQLLGLMRMDKYFGRAFVVEKFRVAGVTQKPRLLYVPDTALGSGFCTPVFTGEGQLVGITVLQLPELDISPDDPFAAMSQMANIEMISGGFILPAETLREATEKAMADAPDEESEAEAPQPQEPVE